MTGNMAAARVSLKSVTDLIGEPKCVVLLVCSGGKADREIFSPRLVGFAHELLRAGAASVVASAWPLDIMTAITWTKRFLLAAFEDNEDLVYAVFTANSDLRVAGRAPNAYLAMNVYGKPTW